MIDRFTRAVVRRVGKGWVWGFFAGGLCVVATLGSASEMSELDGRECLIGETARVSGDAQKPGVLLFDIDQPGVLTVVASAGAPDVEIVVGDAFGQPLVDGQIDMDPPALPRGEFGAVGIAKPGRYTVMVLPLFEESHVTAEVYTAFVAVPEMVGGTVDPNGQPDTALELVLGERVDERLSETDGDTRDWYVFVPERSGSVRVDVKAYGEVDLVLDRYREGRFWMAEETSDEDLNDHAGSESLTFDVREGVAVYLRVGPNWVLSEGEAYGYSLEAVWKGR